MGEPAKRLVQRLALAKADAVSTKNENTWVVGSDQVAVLDDRIIGKPGGQAAATAQLNAMSGRSVEFLTAVCLAGPDSRRLCALDITTVRFRSLQADEIERYLQCERPYDCAGSFKSEGLGICLFEAIDSRDPTGLIGLPLIATARLLREAGFALP